jgi:hypothetical protein
MARLVRMSAMKTAFIGRNQGRPHAWAGLCARSGMQDNESQPYGKILSLVISLTVPLFIAAAACIVGPLSGSLQRRKR